MHFLYKEKKGFQIRYFDGSGHPSDFIMITGLLDYLNSLFNKPAETCAFTYGIYG
jgi:hypothetical protein